MTDIVDHIVERLRDKDGRWLSMYCNSHQLQELRDEAAFELERLTAENWQLFTDLDWQKDEIGRLAITIDRLRAAMLAVRCPGGGYTGMPANTEPTVAACLAAGVCGCSYGDALKDTPRQPCDDAEFGMRP